MFWGPLLIFSFVFFTLQGLMAAEATMPTMFVSPPATLLTKTGHNRQPVFVSNSGVIFVSSSRRAHQDPQLYFLDLENNKERRITFQRGIMNNGAYNQSKNLLFYSSSTDEDKETPVAMKNLLKRFPASVKNEYFFHLDFSPQEIYSSRLDGSDIERLTESMGFDGFPLYNFHNNKLYFSRWEKNQLKIFSQTLKKPYHASAVSKTSGHDLGLQFSKVNKKFVWSQFSPDFTSSQILIDTPAMKAPQFATLNSGLNWSPTWHPNGKSIIYSAKAKNKSDFDLYEVSMNGDCTRQITSYQGDEFFPAVSPDGKKILFTSTQKGSEQIYQLPYPGPLKCQ